MWYVFLLSFEQKVDLSKVKYRSLSPSSIFFGFGHTQSNDVKGKKNPAPLRELLKKHNVVIADKYVFLILFLYYQPLTL